VPVFFGLLSRGALSLNTLSNIREHLVPAPARGHQCPGHGIGQVIEASTRMVDRVFSGRAQPARSP
jgi:hypothetical protein